MEKKLGGARPGAGRKPVADEKKVNEIFLSALKQVNNVDTDEEAKIAFAKTLLETQRGQIFIAEHLYGKPKETIDQNVTIDNFSLKDVISFDKSK
jgi:hypothetical protein